MDINIAGFIILAGLGLLCWAEAGLVSRYLYRKKIFVIPNEASAHIAPTPPGGGIAVCDALLVGLVIFIFTIDPAHPFFNWRAGVALFFLAVISWLDDIRPLEIFMRFTAQIFVVALMLPLLPDVNLSWGLPGWVLWLSSWMFWAMAFLFWLGVINMVNFMDGADGLTAVEIISIFGGIALMAFFHGDKALWEGWGLPSLAVVAIMLGFLPWNWTPARLFLGDVGSVSLGFITGGVLLHWVGLGFWEASVILPLFYYMDIGWNIISVALSGHKPWMPHRRYFYKRALDAGVSHPRLTRAVLYCNIILIAIALISPKIGWWYSIPMAIIPPLVLIFWILQKVRNSPATRPAFITS